MQEIFKLSEEEYLEICRQKYHETKEEHAEKLQLKRRIKEVSQAVAKGNSDWLVMGQLPQAINVIIRCKLGIRRMDNLKAEDIPKATEIVNQIGNIILEAV